MICRDCPFSLGCWAGSTNLFYCMDCKLMHVIDSKVTLRGCANNGTTVIEEAFHIFRCDPITRGDWSDHSFTSVHAKDCPNCSPMADQFQGCKVSHWADQTKKREWLERNNPSARGRSAKPAPTT